MWPLGGLAIIAILVVANIWLGWNTFGKKYSDNLPHLNINPIKATSFVFTEKNTRDKITWENPQNILILGHSGEGYIAPDLTDTIMVLHVNPLKDPPLLKLVSLPRDLFIEISSGQFSKINDLWRNVKPFGEAGINLVKEKIENITSLSIDSVIIFDLETVSRVVEKIDGVTVFIKDDIYDPTFPKKNGGYETFSLKKGWRYLSAAETLRFIRTRSSLGGDFDRISHQQELLRAIKGKLVSLNPIWNFPTLWSIFNIVKDEVITDLTLADAKNLWLVSEKISFDKIETLSIDGPSGLVKPKTIYLGGIPAYTLVASGDPFDYTKIQEAIQEFINEL